MSDKSDNDTSKNDDQGKEHAPLPKPAIMPEPQEKPWVSPEGKIIDPDDIIRTNPPSNPGSDVNHNGGNSSLEPDFSPYPDFDADAFPGIVGGGWVPGEEGPDDGTLADPDPADQDLFAPYPEPDFGGVDDGGLDIGWGIDDDGGIGHGDDFDGGDIGYDDFDGGLMAFNAAMQPAGFGGSWVEYTSARSLEPHGTLPSPTAARIGNR